MKEFAPPAFETQEARHHQEQHETHAPKVEHKEVHPKKEIDPRRALQEVRKAVHEAEQSQTQEKALKHLEQAVDKPRLATPRVIDAQLRKITLRRELKAVQRKLPASERALSKVIHKPVVRAVSEATGKTLSRPSGILGGGLVALVGTSGYLYLAKHLGFTYNYFVFLALFVGGFALGLILELLVWVLASRNRRLQ